MRLLLQIQTKGNMFCIDNGDSFNFKNLTYRRRGGGVLERRRGGGDGLLRRLINTAPRSAGE